MPGARLRPLAAENVLKYRLVLRRRGGCWCRPQGSSVVRPHTFLDVSAVAS